MRSRELGGVGTRHLTANSAQLSIRDLRLRPLRAVVQAPPPPDITESPLELALIGYLDALP